MAIAADVGIDFAVAALEIGIRHHARSAVSGTADVNDVEVTRADRSIEMGVDKV